ncbi:MAG: serine/threonine-protein kinase [Planctomycetota bacterium]
MSEPSPPKPGDPIGSYELIEPLGQGAMGQVWLARHRLLGRRAAVKLINPRYADPEQRDAPFRRFEREANATGRLESPYTVRIYDFGVSDAGSLYYAMEHLRGADLQRVVTELGPLPAARVVALADQVCGSLGEAHAAGLVHRDLKPANVFLCELGLECDVIKVLDFGLVKRMFGDTERDLTGGRMVGSPAFCAPEACSGVFSPLGDIYSLGCTLFWLLTGAYVFDEHNFFELVEAHLTREPAPPSTLASGVPPELDALVLECLCKDPEERPATVREVRRSLRAIPFAQPWTHTEAEAWWDTHREQLLARPTAPEPVVDENETRG